MPGPYRNADLTPQVLKQARVYERNQTAYARLRAKATGGRVLKDDDVEVLGCNAALQTRPHTDFA